MTIGYHGNKIPNRLKINQFMSMIPDNRNLTFLDPFLNEYNYS